MSCPKCGRSYGKRKRCYSCSPGKSRTGRMRKCRTCGKKFYVQAYVLNGRSSEKGLFCSQSCKYEAVRGVEKSKGHCYTNQQGYIIIKTGIRKYELEHRVVMAEKLGRPLKLDEHIHHINGKKYDNRPENLEVVSNPHHGQIHGKRQPRIRINLTCQWCGKPYQVMPYKAKESKYCQNACRLAALHVGNKKKEA